MTSFMTVEQIADGIGAKENDPPWLKSNREISIKVHEASQRMLNNPSPFHEAHILTDEMLRAQFPNEYVLFDDTLDGQTNGMTRRILFHTPLRNEYHDLLNQAFEGGKNTGAHMRFVQDAGSATLDKLRPTGNNVSIYADAANIQVSVSALEKESGHESLGAN